MKAGQIRTLAAVLDASEPRPPDEPAEPTKAAKRELAEEKRKYATRFAGRMACCIANNLRPRFKGILPDAEGRGGESPAQSVRGPKRLDVNYSTSLLGLGFGVSLKAVHFREKPTRGFIHNRKRNDEELRVEASGYHARQPHAVMIGVVFMPYEAASDGTDKYPSSFGEWVQYLRPLARRQFPHEDGDRYERVFVGLYDRSGSTMEFFDVVVPPPRQGPPKKLLSFREFLDEIELTFLQRNAADFEWADDATETDEPPPDEDS